MAKYSTNKTGESSVNAEQIQNNVGSRYRASGNLLIIKPVVKTIPAGYVGNRGSVTGFSAGSGFRMRRYLRECISEYGHMVTLTYPGFFPSDGATVKNHLRRFLQEVRRWDNPRGQFEGSDKQEHSAFWFLEFQARGAPHFHIFLNRCPNKKWVSKRWYDIVASDDIRHLQAGTRTEILRAGRAGTISYASKYAAKAEQKVVPDEYKNVGRFWGVYGCRYTVSADVFVSRADLLETDVQQAVQLLENRIKSLVLQGKAELLRDTDDVMIYVTHGSYDQQRIRFLVSRITYFTSSNYCYFTDAELDSE